MRRAQLRRVLIAVVGVACGVASSPFEAALGQEIAFVSQRPRFLFRPDAGAAPVEVDVSRTAMLQYIVSLHVDQPTIGRLLSAIEEQTRLTFAYDNDFPADRPITFRADSVTVAAALSGILLDTGVDVVLSRRGHAALVKAKRQAAEEVQQGTITGLVTDAATDAPLASVHVQVVGTSIAELTDDAGRYTLSNVPAGAAEVQAQQIGYRTLSRTVPVADGETMTADFALEVLPTSLNELVVTVTGEQRVREVGNVVARIRADSLAQTAPVMSFGDLLLGREPGLLSLQETGKTGQAGTIRIRGLNSALLSNEPIVVIDGVRVEAGPGTGSPAEATVSGIGGYTGRLSDLNPDEIASVEVVKGPAASTLYGTDAANGVLVITTKRGQPGRTRWTVLAEQGLVDQQLDYADSYSDGYYPFGRSTADDSPVRCTLQLQAAGGCVLDSVTTFNTFDHPETRPFKAGHRQQYGLQASGGTEGGTTYFLSGEYEQETGTWYLPAADRTWLREQRGVVDIPDWQVRPNAYDRVNLRANVTMPLGQRANVTLATGFVSNQARQPGLNYPGTGGQVGYRDERDGWPADPAPRPAEAFAIRGDDDVRRFIGSLAATYSVRDWLMLKGTVGADLSTNAYGMLLRRGEGVQSSAAGWRRANDLSVARYSFDLGATATRPLSTSMISKTSIGVQYNRRAQRGTHIFVRDLPLGGETIAGGTVDAGVFGPTEGKLTTAVAGGYVEEQLGFRDRLFLTGAVRLDGGSAFGEDFSVAAYPKAAVSWVVTDDQAGPRLPAVSTLRLRAAYGMSGVQPGPTDALARVTVTNGLTVDGTAAGPVGRFEGGNPDLKPERSSELEAGLDLELWESRLRMELTAYQRTISDALVRRLNAPDVGGARIENLGSVRNRGLEFLLSADLLQSRTLAAGFTATASINENRLRSLAEGVLLSPRTKQNTRHDLGYPLFGLWAYTIEGFGDTNGNGIIEPTEVGISGPYTSYIGPNFPTREATASPYLKLFGDQVHLNGLLQYRGDYYRYRSPNGCYADTCREVNDPETPLAEQAATVATVELGANGPAYRDASYLLLRELSLALTLPASIARSVGARGGQVVLAGRNVALLWKASDLPIEQAIGSRDSVIDGTNGRLSPSTYWLLRANLNF